jgi:hypothetical protein
LGDTFSSLEVGDVLPDEINLDDLYGTHRPCKKRESIPSFKGRDM